MKMKAQTLKIVSFLFILAMVLNVLVTPIVAMAEKAVDDCVKELIVYYRDYQGASETDIMRVLDKMSKVNSSKAEAWGKIMDFWSYVNTDMVVNENTPPEGLPTDNSVAIVILGYALNTDGTMKPELVGRLEAGLELANKYPNAYIVVTGGQERNGKTEGDSMAAWLKEKGVNSSRIIVENKAADTVGNAKNTYTILRNQYPQVKSMVMVTSDYHIPRGSILFYSKCLLSAYEAGDKNPLELISNYAYSTATNGYESISLQASGVATVAGVSISSTTASLSLLTQLDIEKSGSEYSAKATYHTGFSRDVTANAEFKANGDTVAVSYTENGITIGGEFAASATKASFFSYEYLQKLINETESKTKAQYTKDSYAVVEEALTEAKGVLAKDNATTEEVGNAYVKLVNALNNLTLLTNIARGKHVEANCGNASYTPEKTVDGSISTSNLWASMNGNANVPASQAELIIDLDGKYSVEAITVYTYWHATQKRYYKYELLGSTDGETWFNLATQDQDRNAVSTGFTFETNATVSYVKLKGISTYVEGRSDITNIHVTEIQVFGTEIDNIALNKSITTSGADTSTAGSSAAAFDSKLNDGDRTTYWDAGAYANNPWAIINLGGVYKLDRINVINYWQSVRYYKYEVYTSIDGVEYTKVAEKSANSNATMFGDDYLFTDSELYAGYIKIIGTFNSANSAFHINELRVFGTEVDYELIQTKETLQSTLGTLSRYTESDYTASSWQALQTAVALAENALKNATTAAEAKAAAQALTQAIDNLTYSGGHVAYVGMQTSEYAIRFIGTVSQEAMSRFDKVDLIVKFTSNDDGSVRQYTNATKTVFQAMKYKGGIAVAVSGSAYAEGLDEDCVYDAACLFGFGITNIDAGSYTVTITPVGYIGNQAMAYESATYQNITVGNDGSVTIG